MIQDCKDHRFKKTVWQQQQSIITVTFPGVSHHKKAEGITEGIKNKMKQLLALLYKNEGIRTVDMEVQLEIPAKSLERYIKILRDSGLIEFKGANRSGGYYLTRKSQNKLK